MTEQTSNLKIGLLDNGSHSLKRGYEVWAEWKRSGDAWLLKESVIWIHHGIELLLKQLVAQANEFLVFQDVNKAVERLGILRKKSGMESAGVLDLFDHDDKVMSVGFKNLIDRAAITLNISEISEKEELRNNIEKLTRVRNKIVHFSVKLDVIEISGILSEILNPLLYMLSKEIQDKIFKEKTIPEIRKVAQPLHEYMDYVRNEIVESAVKSTKEAVLPDGSRRAGVVSQAQGSGLSRSLSSYLNLIRGLYDKKIFVLVDQLILAQQLYRVISNDTDLHPILPSSREELYSLIASDSNEVIICNVQKIKSFDIEFSSECLVVGYNIASISEYFEASFPNATYILFTNTPSQFAPSFFGRVVGSFDLHQAINSNISTPLRVENVDLMLETSPPIKDEGAINYSDQFLGRVAENIVSHFLNNHTDQLSKAYIVVRDTDTAEMLLAKILELKPEWHKSTDAREVLSTISSRTYNPRREYLLNNFRDKDNPLELLIGTRKFLIGCDNPWLNAVYLTCPVSRQVQYKISSAVTRYERNKKYGLIVDFCGLDWSLDGFANK